MPPVQQLRGAKDLARALAAAALALELLQVARAQAHHAAAYRAHVARVHRRLRETAFVLFVAPAPPPLHARGAARGAARAELREHRAGRLAVAARHTPMAPACGGGRRGVGGARADALRQVRVVDGGDAAVVAVVAVDVERVVVVAIGTVVVRVVAVVDTVVGPADVRKKKNEETVRMKRRENESHITHTRTHTHAQHTHTHLQGMKRQ